MKYTIPKMKLTMVREPATIALKSSSDAESAIRALCCENPSTESFVVLYLNGQSRIVGGRVIAMGGVSSLSIKAREVFQGACDVGASALVIGHNHPSGDPTPSAEDIELTRLLVAAGKVIMIPIVDHVIVTECGKHFSFLDADML